MEFRHLFVVILLLSLAIYLSIIPTLKLKGEAIVKFSSEKDFREYIEKSEKLGEPREFAMFALGGLRAEVMAPSPPSRISPTTVQVKGIDEPDLVKTDGLRIYFSPGRKFYEPILPRKIPAAYFSKTKIVKAFPPQNLSVLSEINESGELLLISNTLLILSDKIYGYDVSNPELPIRKFAIEFNGSIVGARVYEGKVYMVLRDKVNFYKPCPIYPLVIQKKPISISCTEIYHPVRIIPVDVTYTALILNPETGEIEKTLTFVGSSYSSVVYMSRQAIYITYTYYEDWSKMMVEFLEKECKDIIPSSIIKRLKEIWEYNTSILSKLYEMEIEMEKYLSTLTMEESLKIRNELENRMVKYFRENMRKFVKSGIVKIGLENFEILAIGNIPGEPLNQFSLDEYMGNLRIATTVGFGLETENDVYVLDKNLKIIGSIKGLGLEERIYSVRFIGDKGYVVTFRETDPFYVIDLEDPTNPAVKGELKIPGYSSYLHPLEKHLILGIGKEGWRVKISLFDVSSASKPEEIDKYILDEYWSDVLETHHAFLLDKKHNIFFLPGSKGGYIFSFSNHTLRLEKVVPAYETKRAIYLDDWLYVIAKNEIVVFNEFTWEKVSELKF